MKIRCLDNKTNQQIDVIIATVPWTDSSIPLMAPAALKPIVEKSGHSCLAVDLNAEIFDITSKFPDLDDYLAFFFDGVCKTPSSQAWISDMLLSVSQHMLSWNSKFIGLSVFSYACRSTTKWLCYFLKKSNPNVKIILGGAGCLEQFTGPSDYAQELIADGLADYYVRGDGEQSLYQLLTGNVSYHGINDISWKQLDNEEIAMLPMPDYSDYDFSIYKKLILPLQGSRGCVRQCTFCDYIANWTMFRWRPADHVFNEMKEQYQRYGIRTFKFQDTLTNGNIKEFNKLIELLARHNSTHPKQSFRWGGYYIFREKTASDDHTWSLLKQSGADLLIVGIENLNEDIRFAIGKKFSNASIDYHLGKALQHNIRLQFLFIVGYVSETQEHIDFAKQWLHSHTEYQPVLESLQWGGTLGIFPNTWLDRNKEQLPIKILGPKPHMWSNPQTGNNQATRARWVNELNQLSKDLGYTVSDFVDNHFLLEQMINVVE